MTERKSYGQFCGLARSLDHVGDRWTLLVIRELLLAPQTFRELQARLAGISPTLLTARLRDLVLDGLVTRSDAPQRSPAVAYELTPAGRDLEPAILALISWGTRWMSTGPGDDRVEAAWSPLALRALLEAQPASREGVLQLSVSGQPVTITARAGRRTVTAGSADRADAFVELDLPQVLAVASGQATLRSTGGRVSGRHRTAAALLQPA